MNEGASGGQVKTFTQAREQGYESQMLKDIVHSIWRFFYNEEVPEVN